MKDEEQYYWEQKNKENALNRANSMFGKSLFVAMLSINIWVGWEIGNVVMTIIGLLTISLLFAVFGLMEIIHTEKRYYSKKHKEKTQ